MKIGRTFAGFVPVVIGAVLVAGSLLAPTASATEQTTQTVALHNNTAQAGTSAECPADTSVAYWHFVIAPNNGSFAFVSMTLNLGAGNPAYSVSGASIIPNGGQNDNVFVAVPAGSTITDLQVAGSSAEITPSGGSPQFNLSHTCDGGTPPTSSSTSTTSTTTTEAPTTTSSTTTTTTEAPTTTSSTTTTTTEAPTTTSSTTTTTTEAPTTTTSTTTTDPGSTTTSVDSETPVAPSTTVQVASAAPVPPSVVAQLPRTGAASTVWLQIGAFLMVFGFTLLGLARRHTA